MGYCSSIRGDIFGVSREGYEEIKENLSESFREIYFEDEFTDGVICIESYDLKHYDVEDPGGPFDLIASKIETDEMSILEEDGEAYDDLSQIYFKKGKWKRVHAEIIYPDDPFKEHGEGEEFLKSTIDKGIIALSIYEMNNKKGVYDNKRKLKEIDKFSDQDVKEIVNKLRNTYLNGSFWEGLYQITEEHLKTK